MVLRLTQKHEAQEANPICQYYGTSLMNEIQGRKLKKKYLLIASRRDLNLHVPATLASSYTPSQISKDGGLTKEEVVLCLKPG